MTKIKHQYHFHFWIWIKKNEKKHRWHFSFNLICHLFWKGGRRAMGMNSKPSFKNVATGTCYWCVTASCYLINFKMHCSFPESDLGLSAQHSSGDAPFFVSSFFKECAVYAKLVQNSALKLWRTEIGVLWAQFPLLQGTETLWNSYGSS